MDFESIQNILFAVSSQLVIVPTAYLVLAPMRASEWISRRTFVTLLVLMTLAAFGCAAVSIYSPKSEQLAGVTVAALFLLVVLRKSRLRPSSVLTIFFTVQFFVYSVCVLARLACFCLSPTIYQQVGSTWESHAVLWAMLFVSVLAFRPIFIERISYIVENCEAGRAPASFRQGAWLLPLACNLVEVFAIDTSPAALVRPGALATTLFVQIVLLILYYTIIAFEYRLMQNALDNEKSLNRQHLLNLQLQQNSIMKDRIEQARRARHDLRHFRNVVAVYAREGDVEGLREYLGQLDAIADDDPLVWCENTVVNAILGHYVAKARELGADVQVHATVPQDCPLTEVQSSVVVGNVLENAVSALEHAKDVGGVRLAISINVAVRDNNQFTLDVRNTYAGEILRNGQGRLLSTKHEGTGVGTASVTALAEQAGGFARFGSEGGLFRSFVLLPLA